MTSGLSRLSVVSVRMCRDGHDDQKQARCGRRNAGSATMRAPSVAAGIEHGSTWPPCNPPSWVHDERAAGCRGTVSRRPRDGCLYPYPAEKDLPSPMCGCCVWWVSIWGDWPQPISPSASPTGSTTTNRRGQTVNVASPWRRRRGGPADHQGHPRSVGAGPAGPGRDIWTLEPASHDRAPAVAAARGEGNRAGPGGYRSRREWFAKSRRLASLRTGWPPCGPTGGRARARSTRRQAAVQAATTSRRPLTEADGVNGGRRRAGSARRR